MPLCPQEAADGSGSSRDSPVDPRMWIILETSSPKISWCYVCFFMCETIRSMCLWLWCQQEWTKDLQCFALRRHTGSYEQSSFAHELARWTCSCRRPRWDRRPSSGKASEDSSCGREGIGSGYEGGTTPVSSCVEHSLLGFIYWYYPNQFLHLFWYLICPIRKVAVFKIFDMHLVHPTASPRFPSLDRRRRRGRSRICFESLIFKKLEFHLKPGPWRDSHTGVQSPTQSAHAQGQPLTSNPCCQVAQSQHQVNLHMSIWEYQFWIAIIVVFLVSNCLKTCSRVSNDLELQW